MTHQLRIKRHNLTMNRTRVSCLKHKQMIEHYNECLE